MKLAVRTAIAAGLLVAMGLIIKDAHLDRAAAPMTTHGAVTVAMTDTEEPCVIRVQVAKAPPGRHGADVSVSVVMTEKGLITVYVFGDGGYGDKGTWQGGVGGFVWAVNLPHSTVNGVKDIGGVLNVDGKAINCKVER